MTATFDKPVFGTREWADLSANICIGCPNNCKYCFAKASAIRSGLKTPTTWKNMETDFALIDKVRNTAKRKGKRIMFPTQHDITSENCDIFISCLLDMISMGKEVLIVSKPHFECIKAICDAMETGPEFAGRAKAHILFRFTIGSANPEVLEYWEPGAPTFAERLCSLQYAFENGFQTSVSSEPMLDDDIDNVIALTSPYISDAIWLGKGNYWESRLKTNGASNDVIEEGKELMALFSDEYVMDLYQRYKDNPMVKWKESIKKVVGLKIPTEAGLDI